MAWWGAVLGGAFGFMLGGPLGALLGASLGSRFSTGGGGVPRLGAGAQERVQTAFFTATFAVMGHIAKADGRVTRDEIALAEQVMTHIQLNAAQRKLARQLFNQGKLDDFPLNEVLAQFRRECHRRGNLLRMFMEIQIQAAFADGQLAATEHRILQSVASQLGLARADLEQLINFIRGATAGEQKSTGPSLDDAYRILGITAHTPLPEARKKYRRLLSRHHPDKLVGQGLPEEMIRLANEKTHEIRSAWEKIKAARG